MEGVERPARGERGAEGVGAEGQWRQVRKCWPRPEGGWGAALPRCLQSLAGCWVNERDLGIPFQSEVPPGRSSGRLADGEAEVQRARHEWAPRRGRGRLIGEQSKLVEALLPGIPRPGVRAALGSMAPGIPAVIHAVCLMGYVLLSSISQRGKLRDRLAHGDRGRGLSS